MAHEIIRHAPDSPLAPLLRSMSYDRLPLDRKPFTTVSFENVSRSGLRSAIRNLQHLFLSPSQSGKPAPNLIIEITLLSQKISLLDPQTAVLHLLPFILSPGTSENGMEVASTSVLVRLADVLQLLTTGPHAFVIGSVRDVSKARSNQLNRDIGNLTYGRSTETGQNAIFGTTSWRESILRKQWEAALYTAGKLTRWWIVIGKH